MPIHQALAGLLGKLGGVAERAPMLIASRIAWQLGRSIGLVSNVADPGRPTLLEAVGKADWLRLAERFVQGVGPQPFGLAGLGLDFWRGAAYENRTELLEGWLSGFAEMFVPGTDINRFLQAAQRGQVGNLIDPGLDRLFENLGLEDVTALFRGMDEVAASVTTTRPFEALAGAISGFFAWLGGLDLDFLKPMLPEEAKEEGERGADIITDAAGGKGQDAISKGVRTLVGFTRTPVGKRLIEALKEDAKKGVSKAIFEKVRRVIGRL